MKKVLLSITVAATFLLTGCSHMGGYGPSSDVQDVNRVIKIAQMKYNKVHADGIAWQKTKAKITKAKELAAAGKNAQALAQANEAIYEADQATMQSAEAEKTWHSAVPQ